MYIQDENGNKIELLLNPSGDTYPIGMYGYFAGENAPTNWLRCDGQLVLKSEYPELFNAIGTIHNKETDTDETKFRLPNVNLEHRTLVGSSGDGEFSVGNTGGEKTHTLTKNEIPYHDHSLKWQYEGGTGSGHGTLLKNSSDTAQYSYNTGGTGGGQPHNNMPPYVAGICCIKAKQSAGIVGDVTNNINDTNENAVPNAKTVKDYAKKRVATASLTSGIIGMGQGNINLNNILSNTDNLTLSNGGIKIGAGISKILVSGEVFGNAKSSNTSYLWIYIKKNNEIVSNALSNPSSWFTSTVLAPKLIEVSEGDILHFYKEDDVTTDIRSGAYTWLTVEVVE